MKYLVLGIWLALTATVGMAQSPPAVNTIAVRGAGTNYVQNMRENVVPHALTTRLVPS